jgi:uncharacterized cupredoxin-like copper-binding protein
MELIEISKAYEGLLYFEKGFSSVFTRGAKKPARIIGPHEQAFLSRKAVERGARRKTMIANTGKKAAAGAMAATIMAGGGLGAVKAAPHIANVAGDAGSAVSRGWNNYVKAEENRVLGGKY